jgi:hypothetical protein
VDKRETRIGTRIAHSKFQKCSQLFIRTHNKTLAIAAMRVSNPDCSAFNIQR